MLRLMIKPKDREGVIMFVKSYKRNWNLKKKLKLTPLIGKAITFENKEKIKAWRLKIEIDNIVNTEFLNDDEINYYREYHQFYVIAKHTNKGFEYYSFKKEVYNEKSRRMIKVIDFTQDVNRAMFFKSFRKAFRTLIKVRPSLKGRIELYNIFLTIENDYTKKNKKDEG